MNIFFWHVIAIRFYHTDLDSAWKFSPEKNQNDLSWVETTRVSGIDLYRIMIILPRYMYRYQFRNPQTNPPLMKW